MKFVFIAFVIFIIIFILGMLLSNICVVPQGNAWIIERLGKFHKIADAGLTIIIPFIDHVRSIVSLKQQTMDIPPQGVITKDNVNNSNLLSSNQILGLNFILIHKNKRKLRVTEEKRNHMIRYTGSSISTNKLDRIKEDVDKRKYTTAIQFFKDSVQNHKFLDVRDLHLYDWWVDLLIKVSFYSGDYTEWGEKKHIDITPKEKLILVAYQVLSYWPWIVREPDKNLAFCVDFIKRMKKENNLFYKHMMSGFEDFKGLCELYDYNLEHVIRRLIK